MLEFNQSSGSTLVHDTDPCQQANSGPLQGNATEVVVEGAEMQRSSKRTRAGWFFIRYNTRPPLLQRRSRFFPVPANLRLALPKVDQASASQYETFHRNETVLEKIPCP